AKSHDRRQNDNEQKIYSWHPKPFRSPCNQAFMSACHWYGLRTINSWSGVWFPVDKRLPPGPVSMRTSGCDSPYKGIRAPEPLTSGPRGDCARSDAMGVKIISYASRLSLKRSNGDIAVRP